VIKSRDVLAIADHSVRPPGRRKWQICVSAHQRYFLRINSQPLWPPHFKLEVATSPFLKHDSYVELRQLIRFSQEEIEKAIEDPANLIGSLSRDVAYLLASEARNAVTLTDDQKDIIYNNLTI
jgi:hypothetical protein